MKLKTFLIILAAILCVGLIAGGVARNNGGSAQSVSVRPNSAANNGTVAVTEAPATTEASATTEADEPATEPETVEAQGPKILLLISRDAGYDFCVYEGDELISPIDTVEYSAYHIRPSDYQVIDVDRYVVTPGNSSVRCSGDNESKADVTDYFSYQYVVLERDHSCFYIENCSEGGPCGSEPDWFYDIPEQCVFFYIY